MSDPADPHFGDPVPWHDKRLKKCGGFAIVTDKATFETNIGGLARENGWFEITAWAYFFTLIIPTIAPHSDVGDIYNSAYLIPNIDDTTNPPKGVQASQAYIGRLFPFDLAYNNLTVYFENCYCFDAVSFTWSASGSGPYVPLYGSLGVAGDDYFAYDGTVYHGHDRDRWNLIFPPNPKPGQQWPWVLQIYAHSDEGSVTYNLKVIAPPKPGMAGDITKYYIGGGQTFYTPPSASCTGGIHSIGAGCDLAKHGYTDRITEFMFLPCGAGTGVWVWDGSEWVCEPVKIYDGSTFSDPQAIKVWDGSDWKECGCMPGQTKSALA